MTTATAGWPQQSENYCGVANILTVEMYGFLKSTGSTSGAPYPSQSSIANLLNSPAAVSPWGPSLPTGSHLNPGFFKADIADDGGTDSRSMAWGAWDVTPYGYYFHNYIYSESGTSAIYAFASDYGPAHGLNDPISVDINQGAHSFIIDGVYATNDPSAGGETVDAIDTWDPAYGSGGGSYNSSRQEVWSMYDWMNKYYPTSNSYLWKYPYSSTANGGSDPDPSTNPPYYNSTPNHWNRSYVTIEQDLVTRCQASPNIAYDQNGNEVYHHGTTYCP